MFMLSCSQAPETKQSDDSDIKSIELQYAERFAIKKATDFTVLELLGNKSNNDVTANFVLYKNQKPDYNKDAFYIKIPVSRVACMSSIYTTMLTKLHCENTIVAIDNVDYYNDFIFGA
jgi:hypothetical protein